MKKFTDSLNLIKKHGQKHSDMNTELREKAKNDMEKYCWIKMLMNNAVFRKTLEHVRDHINVKLIQTKQGGII